MDTLRLLQYLASEIQKQIAMYVDSLSYGTAKEEEYRTIAGTIKGLRITLGIITDTINRAEHGEDIDD